MVTKEQDQKRQEAWVPAPYWFKNKLPPKVQLENCAVLSTLIDNRSPSTNRPTVCRFQARNILGVFCK